MVIEIGKLKISGAALLALAAAYFFDSGGILAAVVIAVAAHEAGHYAALKISGQRISALKLELWGLTMCCDTHLSYLSEIITAAAGPLASLVLAISASLVGRHYGMQEAYIVSGVSFTFFLFNALPALPMDGGKILYAAVALVSGIEKAERLMCIVSCAVIMTLLTVGMAVLLKTQVNFTLILSAVWLLISYCKRSGISIKSKRKNDGSESWIRN